MTKIKWSVVDLETDNFSKKPLPPPDPFDRRGKEFVNDVVMYGELNEDGLGIYYNENIVPGCGIPGNTGNPFVDRNFLRNSYLIGHNIKFDLHYIRRDTENCDPDQIEVWDTMLAEYLIEGQKPGKLDLDSVSVKYGGDLKNEEVKQMWDDGIHTADIPKDTLHEYLVGDLKATKNIAVKQMQSARDLGIVQFIKSQMDALLAVQEMEMNGMYIDWDMLDRLRKDTLFTIDHNEKMFKNSVLDKIQEVSSGTIDSDDLCSIANQINPSSNKLMAALLYGGAVTFKVPKYAGVYKTGKKKGEDKYIKKPIEVTFPRITKLRTTEKGNPSLSEHTIKDIMEEGPFPYMHILLFYNNIKEYQKIHNTFIEGLYKFRRGFVVHHNLNQTVTSTGRLSSSNPNFQNYPTKGVAAKIKKAFVSRFAGGSIMEIDYKQLEVVALAYLSGDEELQQSIIDGTDIHSVVGNKVYGAAFNEDKRRTVKVVVFATLYGGGPDTIAKQSGLSIGEVRSVQEGLFRSYPGIKKYHQKLVSRAYRYKMAWGRCDKTGHYEYEHVEVLPTGRRLTYRTNYGKFSPTKLVNYPVQAFATADIMPLVLGKIVKAIYKKGLNNQIKLVNQIHDSVILDVAPGYKETARELVSWHMRKAPEYLKELGVDDFNLPLLTETKVGPNWYDMVE